MVDPLGIGIEIAPLAGAALKRFLARNELRALLHLAQADIRAAHRIPATLREPVARRVMDQRVDPHIAGSLAALLDGDDPSVVLSLRERFEQVLTFDDPSVPVARVIDVVVDAFVDNVFRAKRSDREATHLDAVVTRATVRQGLADVAVQLDRLGLPKARGAQSPWMVPAPSIAAIDRPELREQLARTLLEPGTEAVAVTTSVEGAGGFGKTTLVQIACSSEDVRQRFPGGALWITVGERARGPELASLINDMCELLSGERPAATDPSVAGAHLGELLDSRPPTLLVIDDVWRRDQLEPLLLSGRRCIRLVTTRVRGVVPGGGPMLLVDQMTADEASQSLTAGGVHLSPIEIERLLHLTGRWPVLLGLVNRALVEYISQENAPPRAAFAWLISRLTQHGPTALDVNDEGSRAEAVAATMDASISLLSDNERERYLELAICPEDIDIPADVLDLLWASKLGSGAQGVHDLRDKLLRLRLARGRWVEGQPVLRLHDVVHEYLRHRAGGLLREAHRSLVAAAQQLLDATHGNAEPTRWWELPGEQRYLWRFIVLHLVGAGQPDAATALACDLRWVVAKLRVFSSPALVESDLLIVGTATATTLYRALGGMAPLLAPLDPERALGSTLASRLTYITALKPAVKQYFDSVAGPTLRPRWDLPDPLPDALRRTLAGHAGRVRGLAFSPDGAWLLSASQDRTVRLWDVVEGKRNTVLGRHDAWVGAVAVAPGGGLAASGGGDGIVRVWQLDGGWPHCVLARHTGVIFGIAFSPDGALLASGGGDAIVRVWNVRERRAVAELRGHDGMVFGVSFSPAGGGLLASAGDDRTVRLWDVDTGRQLAVLRGHTSWVRGVAFSADGRLLATGGGDRRVRLWDPFSAAAVDALHGHNGPIRSVAWSPDGQQLASAGGDNRVRVWDAESGRQRVVLSGHGGWVGGVAFSPDSKMLASSSEDRMVRLWHPASTNAQVTPRHEGWVGATAFAPDGGLLASAGGDRLVRLWGSTSGQLEAELVGHTRWVSRLAFSPDGRTLASGGRDHVVRLWDIGSREPCGSLVAHGGWITSVHFSPDGSVIATASGDGTVRLWDADTGRVRGVLTRVANRAASVVFSPDGRLLAVVDGGSTVRLWHIADGFREGHPLETAASSLRCLAFSPCSQWLAVGGGDRRVLLLDLRGGTRATLRGHAASVRDLAFSSDGEHLASVGVDCTVRVWNVESNECLTALRVTERLASCSWHPAGGAICVGGSGGLYMLDFVA
jgi:WD40 repeat protein